VAVIWQQTLRGTRYEVRRAGRSHRLYTDGVFHSQYNPGQTLTRSVWDLLMIPAFFLPAGAIRRVLVLGVGGGTVLHLLRDFVRPQQMVGVELNPVHLRLARRFFGVTRPMATLIQADAIRWLRDYRGAPFDLIIDDLFFEQDGEGIRAAPLTRAWFRLLHKNLSRHGLAVVNVTSGKTLAESAYFSDAATARRFPAAYRLSLPQYHNIVAAFLKQPASPRALRQHLRAQAALSGRERLAFRIARLARPRARP
jgi:spermidine synthase